MRIILIAMAVVVMIPIQAAAHGGGLDRNGGHYNRRTGEYHCHREPCFSMRTKGRPPLPRRHRRARRR